MRWLGGLAVLLLGAAIYLYVVISDGSAKPSPRSTQPETTATNAEDAPSPTKTPAPYQPKPSAPATTAPSTSNDKRAEAPPSLAPSPSSLGPAISEGPAKKGPAELGDPKVPWTEPERQQWLWTANGRFEKGNYPGALEASLEIARRNPGSAWEQDAWRVAIKSYCAMSEPEKAQALFAKMTDQTGIDETIKGCAEWNVKLPK